MLHPRLPSPPPRRIFLRTVALGAAAFAAGCAQIPDLGTDPQMRHPDALRSAEALRASAGRWPVEHWWREYGDDQLNGLVEEALVDAPGVAAAAARLRSAEAMAQVAGARLAPQVSGNASVSQDRLSANYLTPPSAMPQGWNDYGRVTLDARWELDFWGRNRAGLAAATSEREASRAELAQARLMLASGIASAYARLSRLHASRDTALRSVEVRSKTAELFSRRHAHGLETLGSLREAEARRAVAEGAVLALDEQIALQRNQLAALVGAGPDRGLAIARPAMRLDRGFGLPAELALDLVGRRPDIVAARLQAEARARRIDQKRAEFRPNVNLVAFIGVQSLGLDLLGRSGSTVGGFGPAISLPVFTAGRLQAELRGTHAGYAEAVAAYDATLARALQEVADAAVSQRALGARLAKAQEAVDAATEAHRVARNRYDGGLATYLEVLSAEDGLLASLDALTHLRADSLVHDIALQRALGGGYRIAQS